MVQIINADNSPCWLTKAHEHQLQVPSVPARVVFSRVTLGTLEQRRVSWRGTPAMLQKFWCRNGCQKISHRFLVVFFMVIVRFLVFCFPFFLFFVNTQTSRIWKGECLTGWITGDYPQDVSDKWKVGCFGISFPGDTWWSRLWQGGNSTITFHPLGTFLILLAMMKWSSDPLLDLTYQNIVRVST